MLLNSENILPFIPNGLGEFGKKAQIGIDCSVKNITRIMGGKIYQNGNKEIDKYEEVESYLESDENKNEIKTWILDKGVYSLTFDQGIKLDNKHAAFIVGRSTTNRIATLIRSAVFDPCFECEEVGATMYVFEENIEIQEHSCLAQLIISETQESEPYNGNYQGDKDLK